MVHRDAWWITTHENYPGQIRVIGLTAAGRFITVAMAPTDRAHVWRPITGWSSTDEEKDYYWDQSQ
jgi:hypothetical protein